MYENIICFFSCFSLLPEGYVARVGNGWNRHTPGWQWGFSVKKSLSSCFDPTGWKCSGLYKFQDIHAILPSCQTWTHLQSSILPTKPTRYPHLGNTSVLFTSGDQWISCNAIHAAYTTFRLGHRHDYPRKKVDILSCHPRNPHGISARSSSCLPKETSGHPVMPPTQPTPHFGWGVILFIQGNGCTSCHATHTTCSISKEYSCHYLTNWG